MKFAVVGDPVEHSQSPAIHNAGFRELGIDATFEHLLVSAGEFAVVVEQLRSGHLDGVSVTMPHKHDAFGTVDRHTTRASTTGAVNTITVENGQLVGDNTDVAGVRYSLTQLDVAPSTPVLILGAGGAAAAAATATVARKQYCSTRDRGAVETMSVRVGADLKMISWGEGVAGAILINATPLGMHGEDLPSGIIEVSSTFIDMTYREERSPAILRTQDAGIASVDGTAMLLGQALEAFERFTGRQAPEAAMRAALART